MENKSISKFIVLGLSIFFGLVLLGFFIFKGLKTFSDKDRIVTVKGLAEMNMLATSATFTLNFSYSGDNLQELIKQTENKKNEIISYLINTGFKKDKVTLGNIDVTDRQNYYETKWQNNQEVQIKIDRYTILQSITVRSDDVKNTEDMTAQVRLDLISKDLTCDISTDYSFSDLNSIKPQLIAESTKNARIAGEQFANDSQAKLGKIKTASQGQITIAGKYYYNEENSEKPKESFFQKARVVSTIVFFLE